ncbi:Glyceraldehyde-3-phosphate dehydrogenase 1 [subsurface metagenome]
MKVKIGINGFGRVGRGAFRAGFDNPNVEFVGINDITSANMKKTNVMRVCMKTVTQKKFFDFVSMRFLPIRYFKTTSSRILSWIFFGKRITDKGKNIPIPTFVCGVNIDKYDPELNRIISNASCTTNCYAPVTKILDDAFGVKSGFMTTVHSFTTDQRILDLPHSDFRRARAATLSMIPTSTGAAKAVGKVLPHLEGKLQAISIRVPTPNVSLIDAVYILNKEVTKEEVNEKFVVAAEDSYTGILTTTDEPLVSIDYNGNPHSAIVDLQTTLCYSDQVKIIAWYDNESGYANRMIDLALYINSKES